MISLFDVFVIFVDLCFIFSTYLNHEPPLLYFVFDRKILDFHPADGYLYAVQPASDCRHTSFLAVLLALEIHGKSFLRAVFYWPSMISHIVVGLLFQFIFGESTGGVNYLLGLAGAEGISWFTRSYTAMAVVIAASVWS